MSRIVRLAVNGLLGQFDHKVKFPSDWPFVILYGPNGVGKTKILEVVSATLRGQMQKLAAIPFRDAEFGFDDGARIVVKKETKPLGVDEEELEGDVATIAATRVTIQLYRPGHSRPFLGTTEFLALSQWVEFCGQSSESFLSFARMWTVGVISEQRRSFLVPRCLSGTCLHCQAGTCQCQSSRPKSGNSFELKMSI